MKLFFITLFYACLITNSYAQNDVDQYCHKSLSFDRARLFEAAGRNDDGNIDIRYYSFDWIIDPSIRFIQGTASLKFESTVQGLEHFRLNLTDMLTVDSILYEGIKIDFEHTGYDLNILLPTSLDLGELGDATIYYHGPPPTGGFGSFEVNQHNGVPILWTLSEPYGSQDWWPCKNGLTDKIDSIDVRVTTKKENKVASNGKLVEINNITDELHQYHWKHNYPITSYLVAIAVTNYTAYSDTVILNDGMELEVLNYVYPESLAAAKSGTSALLGPMQYYDSLFYTYPFRKEKFGHAQFGWGGGEEHQTMSFVTNFDIGLLSHELAHQWFGDMVTCGSWEDIWLNEGFATYLEGMMRERFRPTEWYSWKAGKISSITGQLGGSVFVTDTTSVNRIFSGRLTYNKGSYLVHMLRWVLGDKDFFQGVRNYLEDRKYSYAVTSHLKQQLEQVSNKDLEEFFRDWFTGQGYPIYTITWEKKGNKKIDITINQTTSHSSVNFFEMPVPLLVKGIGRDTMLRLDNQVNGQSYTIDLPFESQTIIFDPELWLISKGSVVTEKISSGTDDDNSASFLFPNPVHEKLTINNLKYASSYEIYTQNGQRILMGHVDSEHATIATEILPSGNYSLVVVNSRGKQVFKFSKI